MGVRENAKGNVIAQIMDLLAHIFANAMHAAGCSNHKYYHGDDQDEDTEEEEDIDWQ